MAAKNCPETPRQKMINMMYIVLTAMLALNVAAEVLDAFRVVDASLTQTLEAVHLQNSQIYSAFEQAYAENPTKVAEWKEKSDAVKKRSSDMLQYVRTLKDELVNYSGCSIHEKGAPFMEDAYYHTLSDGSIVKLNKADDLNGPSEFMIAQKRANELKQKINDYREFLISIVGENNEELIKTLNRELNTSDPKTSLRQGNELKTWEAEHFENKPLIAILTLLSKIQIDISNSEANVAKFLYSEIDAGSFKFNRLGARVIANSNVVLLGEKYRAEVFLAAEDTTQQPEIIINNRPVEVKDGKAIYEANTERPGVFKWSGVIKFKNPAGIIKNYPFEQEYQVTAPSVTMSATKMNVFYKGLENPFEVSGSGIPVENLEVTMTNGNIERRGDAYIVKPKALDELGKRTTVSVYANINGEKRLIKQTNWRVKQVPDPVAQVAGKSGGNIKKEVLAIQDGVLAVLEDFDFEFKYTVTEFTIETNGPGGFTNRYVSHSNRFTPEQKAALKRVNINSIVYIADIKAVGDDGSVRSLDPISFKIK